MIQNFFVQIYCWDEHRRLSLTDPQEFCAESHIEAAEKACGKGITLEVGAIGKLTAKVWRIGTNSEPDIKLFYRPPN